MQFRGITSTNMHAKAYQSFKPQLNRSVLQLVRVACHIFTEMHAIAYQKNVNAIAEQTLIHITAQQRIMPYFIGHA